VACPVGFIEPNPANVEKAKELTLKAKNLNKEE
jgi:hypothetical protein